jgi:hypothetical protein
MDNPAIRRRPLSSLHVHLRLHPDEMEDVQDDLSRDVIYGRKRFEAACLGALSRIPCTSCCPDFLQPR